MRVFAYNLDRSNRLISFIVASNTQYPASSSTRATEIIGGGFYLCVRDNDEAHAYESQEEVLADVSDYLGTLNDENIVVKNYPHAYLQMISSRENPSRYTLLIPITSEVLDRYHHL